MNVDIASLYALNNIPTGRRLYALARVADEAQKVADTDKIKSLVAAAIVEDEKTHELEHRWAARKKPAQMSDKQALAQKALRRVDAQVDKTLTSLRDGAQTQARSALPHEQELVVKVQAFLDAIFPVGLAAITSLPYAEELTVVRAIVKNLKGTLAPVVAELGLTLTAARLEGLVDPYDKALQAAGMALDFGTLRSARAKGQTRLLQVVAVITGQFYDADGPHAVARSQMLGPILAQDDAVRQQIRARRAVSDVDPKTGEEKDIEEDASAGEGGTAEGSVGGGASPSGSGQGG